MASIKTFVILTHQICFNLRILWLQIVQINYGEGTEEGQKKQKGDEKREETQLTTIIAAIKERKVNNCRNYVSCTSTAVTKFNLI